MVQGGQDLRPALEPRQTIRVGRKEIREDFQRDIAVQLGVAGAVDASYPAFANLGGDFLDTEASAARQGHG